MNPIFKNRKFQIVASIFAGLFLIGLFIVVAVDNDEPVETSQTGPSKKSPEGFTLI